MSSSWRRVHIGSSFSFHNLLILFRNLIFEEGGVTTPIDNWSLTTTKVTCNSYGGIVEKEVVENKPKHWGFS